MAFSGTLVPVRNLVEGSPERLGELADHCTQVRAMSKCLQNMGLLRHPSIRKGVMCNPNYTGLRCLSRWAKPLCTYIIFHADNRTLYQKLPYSDGRVPPADGGGGGGPDASGGGGRDGGGGGTGGDRPSGDGGGGGTGGGGSGRDWCGARRADQSGNDGGSDGGSEGGPPMYIRV